MKKVLYPGVPNQALQILLMSHKMDVRLVSVKMLPKMNILIRHKKLGMHLISLI